MKFIKHILLLLAISSTSIIYAQYKHEVSINGGGGISSLKYKTDFENSKNKFGGSLGLGYSYFFSKNFGLSSGVDLSFYNGAVEIGNFQSVQAGILDKYDDIFNYVSDVNNYTEKQKATFINIPIMFIYQTNDIHKFYFSAGARFSIPVSGNYKISGATYENYGDFVNRENPLRNPKYMGFGSFDDKDFSNSITFKINVMASVETGIKIRMTKSLFLYSGVYLDYGLTDVIKQTNKSIINYNNEKPIDFINNSLLESNYNTAKPFTDKVRPIAYGVKLRLAFGIDSYKEPEKLKAKIMPDSAVYKVIDKIAVEIKEENKNVSHKIEDDALKIAEAEQQKLIEETEKVEADHKVMELAEAKKVIEQPIDGYVVNGVELSASIKSELDKKIEILKKNPNLKIICEGHTCDLGSNSINNNVGLRRAEVARDYIIEKGVDPSRITIKSKGKSSPISLNDIEENRRKNRRVEFILQ